MTHFNITQTFEIFLTYTEQLFPVGMTQFRIKVQF